MNDGLPPDDAPPERAVYFPRIEPPQVDVESPFEGTSTFYGDRGALFAALARAQGAFPPIPRTREVEVYAKPPPHGSGKLLYTYRYAPLDQVIESCRAALAENGLAYLEKILELREGRLLLAYLTHASGAYCESRLLLPRTEGGPQEFAKLVTYARRYQRQCMLGVSPEEDQDAPDDARDSRPAFTAPPKPPNTPTGEPRTVRDPDAPPPPPQEITPAADQADSLERAKAAADRAAGALSPIELEHLAAFETAIKDVKNRAQLSAAVETHLGEYVKNEKTDQQAAAVMKRARELFTARRKELPR